MTDLEKLRSIFKNQLVDRRAAWTMHKVRIEPDEISGNNLCIDEERVGFKFDKEGRFEYMYNWK